MNIFIKAGKIFTTAYILILLLIYPFYMRDGYNDISEAKPHFLFYVTIAAFLVLLLIAAVLWILTIIKKVKNKEPYVIFPQSISLLDLFMLLYATAVYLSFILSVDRKEAWMGTNGWYMGCMLQLLMIFMYFFISRMWQYHKEIWAACMISSAVVCILGICNRFSFYPIQFNKIQPDFISTLGNINWFCGYFSVLFPIGAGLFVFAKSRMLTTASLLYVFIASMAGFCQGSNSVFLIFGGVLYLLLLLSLGKRKWLKRWLLLVFVWMLSSQAVRGLRFFYPEAYNYETDNLCGMLTGSGLLLVGAGTVFAAYAVYVLALRFNGKPQEEKVKYAGTWRGLLVLFPAGVLLLWLILAWVNTKWGISALEGKSLFTLNLDWGNGRGASMSMGIQIYSEFPFSRKLFGAGPDCFSLYAYSTEERIQMLRATFGNARLANAHNELLTALVNVGAVGLVCYVGIFISGILRFIKKGNSNPALYIPALCAFSYLVHNMVSFAQVLNFPFLFLMLGIGECMARNTISKHD